MVAPAGPRIGLDDSDGARHRPGGAVPFERIGVHRMRSVNAVMTMTLSCWRRYQMCWRLRLSLLLFSQASAQDSVCVGATCGWRDVAAGES